MLDQLLQKNNIDNIVFEKRNRAYGAYALRALYDRYMTRGIIIAALFFLLMIFLPVLIKKLNKGFVDNGEIYEMKEIVLNEAPPIDPKRALPPPPKVISHKKVEQLKIENPEVKKDLEVKEEKPIVDNKTEKTEKPDSNTTAVTSGPESNLTGDGTDPNAGKETGSGTTTETVFRTVEEPPLFPGCDNYPSVSDRQACAASKLNAYLKRNIKYPDQAVKTGITGKCIVSFVVERDGSITNAKLVNDIGAGCGAEALRVVASMNNMPEAWRPGKQRGNPVRVQFNLPISFNLR